MYIIHLDCPIYLQIYNENGFKAKSLNDLFDYILYTHIYMVFSSYHIHTSTYTVGWTNWKGWCVIIIFENIDINIKQTQSNKKSFFYFNQQKKTERSKLADEQNIKPNKKTAQCNKKHFFFAWKIADIQNMFKFKNENQIKTMNAKCENCVLPKSLTECGWWKIEKKEQKNQPQSYVNYCEYYLQCQCTTE